MAEDRKVSSDPVEVIMRGKQYKSIRAYKREQITNDLKRTLSSHNLMEFSEDELYEIMKEVRRQQTANGSSSIKGRLESARRLSDNTILENSGVENEGLTVPQLDKKPILGQSPRQTARESSSTKQIIQKDASDLSVPQMQEMLRDYQREHKGSAPLFLHPEKVKNIIIKPHGQTENVLEE